MPNKTQRTCTDNSSWLMDLIVDPFVLVLVRSDFSFLENVWFYEMCRNFSEHIVFRCPKHFFFEFHPHSRYLFLMIFYFFFLFFTTVKFTKILPRISTARLNKWPALAIHPVLLSRFNWNCGEIGVSGFNRRCQD